jgi:CO/xanthine dehydrogenase Mo-binding subunit
MTNICRCGTYQRIRAAVHMAAGGTRAASAGRQQGLRRGAMTRAATNTKFSRRKFLVSGAAAGGGLALGVNVPGLGDALAQNVLGAEGSEVGAWVVIKSNEDVIIRIARSEMGQGTLTGLAQLVCEELECDWKKVKWEYPTPGKTSPATASGATCRPAAAAAFARRTSMCARVARRRARCCCRRRRRNGRCRSASSPSPTASSSTPSPTAARPTARWPSAAAKLTAPDPKDIKLKDPKDWKVAGKKLKRLDTVDKLTGKQIYAIDVKLPGMLTASMMDAPVFGAKVKSYDEAKAKAMPGVRHVLKVGETGGCRGGGQLVAGQPGAEGAQHRLGGGAPTTRSRASRSWPSSRRASTPRRACSSATRSAMRRRRLPGRPRSSRRCSTRPIRTTPAWSR